MHHARATSSRKAGPRKKERKEWKKKTGKKEKENIR